MSKIIYKPIPGYEGLYSVSNKGDVFSHRRNKKLSPKRSARGYLRVTLCKGSRNHKTFGIHRLVALAFIPNLYNKPTVNHINEVKSDNRVDNLEWATTAEQNIYGTRISRAIAHTDWNERSKKMDYNAIAEKHNYSKQEMCNRKRTRVMVNGVIIGEFRSQAEASAFTGVSMSKVSECVLGTKAACKGYSFESVEETGEPGDIQRYL